MEQKIEEKVIPVSISNFYKPSTFMNKGNESNIPKKDSVVPVSPLPKNGKFYEIEELKNIPMNSVVEKVVYPANGGVLTYLRHYKYPYRGFPFDQTVYLMASFKGFVPVFSAFLKELMKNPLSWLSLRSGLNKCFPILIEHAHRLFRDHFPENHKLYCQSVRELYRSFETLGCPLTQTNEEYKKMFGSPMNEISLLVRIRNLICFVFEFDNAYRYRFQDIFAEMNKEAFLKNPTKETGRLFDILIEREVGVHMKKKWSNLKTLITFILKVDKKQREMAKKLVKSLNIDEIKPQDDDWYFLKARRDYHFGGI